MSEQLKLNIKEEQTRMEDLHKSHNTLETAFGVDRVRYIVNVTAHLVERATPKEGIMIADKGFSSEVASSLCCPNCKAPIINVWNKKDYLPKFCHYCGQHLKRDDE